VSSPDGKMKEWSLVIAIGGGGKKKGGKCLRHQEKKGCRWCPCPRGQDSKKRSRKERDGTERTATIKGGKGSKRRIGARLSAHGGGYMKRRGKRKVSLFRQENRNLMDLLDEKGKGREKGQYEKRGGRTD